MSILNPIIFAAFYGLICVPVAFFGRDRKWGFWGYFFASLLMSPIVGLLFVLASDKPKAYSRARCKNQC